MTNRSPLPDEDHFAKYFSHQQLIRNPPESDNVVGIAPQAVRPRPADNGELSGHHLEFFTATNIDERVLGLSNCIGERRLLTVRRSGRFGVAEVGAIKAVAKSSGIGIEIVHDPIGEPLADPAHSVILSLPVETHLAHEEIAKVLTLYHPTPTALPTR